jgi:hypothetical protein
MMTSSSPVWVKIKIHIYHTIKGDKEQGLLTKSLKYFLKIINKRNNALAEARALSPIP